MGRNIIVVVNLMIFIRIRGRIGVTMRICLKLIRIIRRKRI